MFPAPTYRARLILVAASAALAALTAPHAAPACSICRCGDVAFNALGRDGYATPGLRFAFDWERFDKDEGDPAGESESQVEHRMTALVSWGVRDGLMLCARAPYSDRRLTARAGDEGTETIGTHGFSDPEVLGTARLWGSPMSGLGRRTTLALNAGVKLPWGRNDARSGGQRIDEHAQPGTGSTDAFGGLALLRLIDPRASLFVAGGCRLTGTNDFGYRYGRALLLNVAYEHRLGDHLDGVLELNFRHAGRDRLDADGTPGNDTGGSLLYLTPKLLASLGGGVVLRAAVQIPTLRALNGVQTERAVPTLGVTRMF